MAQPNLKTVQKYIKKTDIDTGEITNYFEQEIENGEDYGEQRHKAYVGNRVQLYKMGLKMLRQMKKFEGEINGVSGVLSATEIYVLLYFFEIFEYETNRISYHPPIIAKEVGCDEKTVSKVKTKLIKLEILFEKNGDLYINNRYVWQGDLHVLAKERRFTKPLIPPKKPKLEIVK